MIRRKLDEEIGAKEGWTWPLGVAKAHYMMHGASLCGVLVTKDEPDRLDRNRFDRCVVCDRRLRKVSEWRREADRRGVHGEAQT